MSLIKPFHGIRSHNSDNISIINNCLYAKLNHVTKNNYESAILSMLEDNIIYQDSEPCFYLHRITSKSSSMLGLITAIDIHVLNTKILLHELTISNKEQSYIKSFVENRMQFNPVLLTYRHAPTLDDYLQQTTLLPADIDIISDDVHYQIWTIKTASIINQLLLELNNIENFCVADGHHRLTALKKYFDNYPRNENHAFLSILISEKYIHLKSYNRVLYGFDQLTNSYFMNQLEKNFHIHKITQPVQQPLKGEFTIYLKGNWLKLTVKQGAIESADIAFPFDPIVADKLIFKEILGITNQSKSNNIAFISENHGIAYFQNLVDFGNARAIIFIPRLSLFDFFNIVTQQIILPPNSTYFEPKLLNGLISYMIN